MAFIKSCSIDSRNDQSPKCEVVHETKLTSEVFWPTYTRLAQSVEHDPDPEVLGSTLAFDEYVFALPCVETCQITRIVKNPTDNVDMSFFVLLRNYR